MCGKMRLFRCSGQVLHRAGCPVPHRRAGCHTFVLEGVSWRTNDGLVGDTRPGATPSYSKVCPGAPTMGSPARCHTFVPEGVSWRTDDGLVGDTRRPHKSRPAHPGVSSCGALAEALNNFAVTMDSSFIRYAEPTAARSLISRRSRRRLFAKAACHAARR